jgi:plastocyanin
MAGQGKASLVRDKYRVLSANSNTVASWTYHVTTASTITLPNTATLSVGDKVTFTKKMGVVPTIQRFGSTVLIKTSLGTDSSVLFDIEAEIIFVWNGTEWEV